MAQVDLATFMANATETFSSIIVVNQTTYNIQKHWMKLAAEYFNIDLSRVSTSILLDTTGDRLNLLKAGLFGYFNEIASSEIKNAVYYKNMMYDEHFLNTASFPESIYNHAKLYNVEITNGTPSHMAVNLVIRRDDLLNSPMLQEVVEDQRIQNKTLHTYQMIISRTYRFSVGKYSFLLPYDVQILVKQTSEQEDEYTITARYLTTLNEFPFIDINSPEIKVYQDMKSAERYVYLQLDIYQLERDVTEFTIGSNDISDNLLYTVNFKNQLATFNVFYEVNGVRYELMKYFNNTYNPIDRDEKYCYYSYVDDDKLQISFGSTTNSFRPRDNSKIIVEVLTTYGQESNFEYNDQIIFNYTATGTNNYAKMLSKVYPITSASGGRDKLSITQEKQKIIQAVLGRDNLIMDSDLEWYFDNINNMNTVNESEIRFLKKRDDIIQRLYSSFLLMRDRDKKVIPTNTAPYVNIPKNYFLDSNNINNTQLVIPEHSAFVYNDDTGKYDFQQYGMSESLKKDLADKNKLVYINPFLTKIDTTPTLKASYYKLDINKDFTVNYSYINNLVNKSIIINKIHISKTETNENDLSSNTYKITFNLNSNVNINELDQIIKVRGKLISRKDNSDYGYFEFNRENPNEAGYDQSKYVAFLSTDRKFNEQNFLSMTNSLYDRDGRAIQEQFIDSDLIIKIGVLIKDDTILSQESNNEINLFMHDAFPYRGRNTPQEDITKYRLAVSVSTIDSVHLYQDLSNIMTSLVTRVYDPTDEWNQTNNKFGPNMDKQLYKNGDTWVVFNDEVHNVDGDGNLTNNDGDRRFHVIGTDVYEYFDAIIPSNISNPEKCWDFFRLKKYSKGATSALMALIKDISNYDPTHTGNDDSFGIMEWTDRNDAYLGKQLSSKQQLNDYAKERGLDVNDILTQLAFMHRELTKDTDVSGFARDPELLKEFMESPGEKAATQLLYDNYYSAKNKLMNDNYSLYQENINTIKENDMNIRKTTNKSILAEVNNLTINNYLQIQRAVYEELTKLGLTRNFTSVILGAISTVNGQWSLGYVTDPNNTDINEKNEPYGLMGWKDNPSGTKYKTHLAKFAESNNMSPSDPILQAKFIYRAITDNSVPFSLPLNKSSIGLKDFLNEDDLTKLSSQMVSDVIMVFRDDLTDKVTMSNTVAQRAKTFQTFFAAHGLETGGSTKSINIFRFFNYYGFNKFACIAILNNMYANSNLMIGELEDPATDDSGFGLFYSINGYRSYIGKHIDTKSRLKALLGKKDEDLYNELLFYYDEIVNNTDTSLYARNPELLERFKNAESVEWAIQDFYDNYLENQNIVQSSIEGKIDSLMEKDINNAKTRLLKSAQKLYDEFDEYGIPQERLFKVININAVNYDHDYIEDDNNLRLNGILAITPDGVYVVRSDLTFTTVNGKQYIVYNNKKHQGLHIKLEDGSIHKILHDGSIDPNAINDSPVDPSVKTIVMFYDGTYTVNDEHGYFVDRSGDKYQITESGLYKIEHSRRYAVESALNINRKKNWYDSQISSYRPKGLYVVMFDKVYKTDQYGLFVGYKKYHYRAIPNNNSYRGLYVITQNESIFKLDMLGLIAASKNYQNDGNFPQLRNIWDNSVPTDENKPVFPFPNMNGYNNGTVDEYNNIHNAVNKDGITVNDLLNNGIFSQFIPEEQKDFRIELIPLVSLRYFQSESEYIYQVLDSYIDILDTVIIRLENNTTIDLKFYNSYGPSNYWYLSNANEEKLTLGADSDTIGNKSASLPSNTGLGSLENAGVHKYISRTNFIYDFTIHLFETIDDDIDAAIKQFISDFVEASNSDNVIPVSNLMRLLEQYFEVIRYIEFNGLAGKYSESITNKYQKIKNRATTFLDMSKEEIREFVPEYVNIRKDLTPNTVTIVGQDGKPETVELQHKKYDYVINITYQIQ